MNNEIAPQLRDRFLIKYAGGLQSALNDFTEGTVVHKCSILAGVVSQVIVEILPIGEKWTDLDLTRQPADWFPKPNLVIEFESPNRIVITRPSEYFSQMYAWSNVQVWDDVGFIISSILIGHGHSE